MSDKYDKAGILIRQTVKLESEMDTAIILSNTISWASTAKTCGNGFISDGFANAAEAIKHLSAENARLQSVIGGNNADADEAFESYLETFGGPDTNAWHDAPVDGVFKDGFNRGLLARPIHAQQSVDRDTIINVLLSIGNMSEGIIADAIIGAIGAQQSPSESRYCNECDWTGTTDRMCGAVGPLCPECGETTGVEQSPAVAVPDEMTQDDMGDEFSKAYKKGWNDYRRRLMCETCDGAGHYDERLGGEFFSNPKVECPDCNGTGEYTPIQSLPYAYAITGDNIDMVAKIASVDAFKSENPSWKLLPLYLDPSPRITEQDAREICESFQFWSDYHFIEGMFGNWLDEEGNALLNKLNDKPEIRPENCRNRLRDEGKPYPKSGCGYCKNGGLIGCPFDKPESVGG